MIKDEIREDLWKSISAHYEKGDFTESLRDAMFLVNEIIREKSGLLDKDGTKLMEASFLGKNAALLINKNETTTEKDIQEGIGYAFKGLSLSVRNPISHENIATTKSEANAILMYISYLLDKIDLSKGKTKIEDWMALLSDDDFTISKEYAELLFNELPTRKRYDLLLEIYRNIRNFGSNKINKFLNLLLDSISKGEHSAFVDIVNKDFMLCKDDRTLRNFLHYFTPRIYADLDKLVQLRIESFLKKSIEKGAIIYQSDIETGESEKSCSDDGTLGTWVHGKISMLQAKEEILNLLFKKLSNNEGEKQYVFEYFSNDVFDSSFILTPLRKNVILNGLKMHDRRFEIALFSIMELEEPNDWQTAFSSEYEECKNANLLAAQIDDIPF